MALHWVTIEKVSGKFIGDRLVRVQLQDGDYALRYLGDLADQGERATITHPDDRELWLEGVLVTRVPQPDEALRFDTVEMMPIEEAR